MEERKDKYMSKGIIYLMTTVVSGLIKIGKTGNDQFENRMRFLESNGYANITGLKREFAIEVDGYDDKEKLIHDIFSKSRIAGTELFALDIEIAKSLFASLDGKQIYPKDKSKKEVFKESTEEIKLKYDGGFIPDGDYVLNRNIKGFGKVNGKATVKDGVFKVLKGSLCGNTGKGYIPSIRRNAKIKDNILQEDIVCMNPSSAGWIVIGKSNNGWLEWKDLQGNSIEKYRDKEK
ncbi:GIY-YIG nuclease family protein [Peptostreptococcus anaerobius]|uniref:GIY-YIG nuclease family protein n=1 Tax=Peptostreptococcus anaerobius TaxID=1261 RepID=UPI002915C9EA|nr:GIY-YIG nuclease family protein [Peptostreptococcus anaerobius]